METDEGAWSFDLGSAASRLFRADGTDQDVDLYYAQRERFARGGVERDVGPDEGSWQIPQSDDLQIGDLLIGVSPQHDIIDLWEARGRTSQGWVYWDFDHDEMFDEPLRFADVLASTGLPTEWSMLEGQDVVDFLAALYDAAPYAYPDGSGRTGRQRARSRDLREAAGRRDGWICRACGLDPRTKYGAQYRKRAMDVHHLLPFSERPELKDPTVTRQRNSLVSYACAVHVIA